MGRSHGPRGGRDQLPIREYFFPILEALVKAGGSARPAEVMQHVREMLKDRLLPGDYEHHSTGQAVWEHHTTRARQALVIARLMARNRQRQPWRITPEGRSELERRDPEATWELIRRRQREAPVKRARRKKFLPLWNYVLPILQTLEDAGGRARSQHVLDRVYELVKDRLYPEDHGTRASGEAVWRNRARQVRRSLVRAGLMAGPARGLWEITADGRAELRRADPEATWAERGTRILRRRGGV